MIFIASTLVMNGGTTFLIRAAKEYDRRGRRCAVLLLTPRSDARLREELSRYAEIIDLGPFLVDRGRIARSLLGAFAPLRKQALAAALAPYGTHLHAMGIFGLILGVRLADGTGPFRLSVGVYHQNEFLYRDHRSFFATRVRALFVSMPRANILFFNESSRDNYVDHFADDTLLASPILPIGIELDHHPLERTFAGERILSIGNLVAFKTYNRHMIATVARLKERFPRITYEIYGTGPTEADLRALATKLGVADRVKFHGLLDYERLREVVAGCDLFVGSGTALIEAAAAGRPALVGIEAIEEPETYGFLSDVPGFSYNEDDPARPKVAMEGLVATVLANPSEWARVAAADVAKAQSFSIATTVTGLDHVAETAARLRSKIPASDVVGMALSAVAMRLREIVSGDERFADRRNQAYRSP